MRTFTVSGAVALLLGAGGAQGAQAPDPTIAELKARLQTLEQQQAELKAHIESLEARPPAAAESVPARAAPAVTDARAFNPGISVILNGKLTAYDRDPVDYAIPGFQLGGEAGLAPRGAGLDESELVLSGNIDDLFYGRLTAALHSEGGETEVELEEAFVETLGLPHGFGVRAGRFFSDVGYLNSRHPHTWDFADTPLAYRAFMGDQYKDDGLQIRWLAPTETFLEAGLELFRGEGFPAGGAANRGLGASTAFARLGGDIGTSHSWRVGLSHLQADAEGRSSGGEHAHGSGGVEPSVFSGDSDVTIADVVWKWAPNGNSYRRNFTFQAEYFQRDENGTVTVDDGAESSTYDGAQKGYYVQGVYQFQPRWRVGARYDRLWSDNRGGDEDVLSEAGLLDGGHTPERYSLMLDYSRSEFSRLRLQYNRDESGPETDHQWILQYIMSLGAHGAHAW